MTSESASSAPPEVGGPGDHTPCVVLTKRCDSPCDCVPGDLLRTLRSRGLAPLMQVDAHEALAELIVRDRAAATGELVILIVVDPVQQPLAAPLLRTVRAQLPDVVTWQYRTEPRPTLSQLTINSLIEPKLRLAHEVPVAEPPDAPENHPHDPGDPPPAPSPEEPRPLLSEEELDMLLDPRHDTPPPQQHGAHP